MAITLDLSPELESKARRAAANDGIPLQEIIERALERMTVSESPALQKSDSSEALCLAAT